MKTAVVYIAGGEEYCRDAMESCKSIKRWNPNLPCILATDAKRNIPDIYDGIIALPDRKHLDCWYLDSVKFTNEVFELLRNDYEALLFLDTDTYCDANLDDMLALTERFDICVTHGVNRQTTNTVKPIPDSFPEFEIGVMLIRTNERVRSLFRDWLELYEDHVDLYGNNDQGPLREALWNNKNIDMYVMPEEFHARFGFGVCVVSRVRLLHSRSPNYPNSRAAREINSTGGRRLYWPDGDMWKSPEGIISYK